MYVMDAKYLILIAFQKLQHFRSCGIEVYQPKRCLLHISVIPIVRSQCNLAVHIKCWNQFTLQQILNTCENKLWQM